MRLASAEEETQKNETPTVPSAEVPMDAYQREFLFQRHWSQAESFPLAPRAPSRLVRPGEGERGVVCRHPALAVATLLARGLSCLENQPKNHHYYVLKRMASHVKTGTKRFGLRF